jgi:hypothetical protein
MPPAPHRLSERSAANPCPDPRQLYGGGTVARKLTGKETRAMKHEASRELYAYWEERRGKRSAPERADIEPGAIRQVLSDAFILALDARAGYPFRLAGTRLCALFGREIKSESFIGLWAAASQPTLIDLLAIIEHERVGTVAGVTAQNGDGEQIELELLLLPLSASRPCLARTIGILAPLKIPSWLGSSPIGAMTLGNRRHIGASIQARILPRFMVPNRRHLVVYEGGRV